jgi:hypothetical protein
MVKGVKMFKVLDNDVPALFAFDTEDKCCFDSFLKAVKYAKNYLGANRTKVKNFEVNKKYIYNEDEDYIEIKEI